DPAWKTGNYLNNVLGLREACARGADEVVMLNHAGEVTEASTSNLAFVRGGTLIVPPLSSGMLGGITRGLVVTKVAPAAGVPVSKVPVKPEEFSAMDECLMLSSSKEIAPVAAIDAARFKIGADTVAARLRMAWADYTQAYVAAHPEWHA